ncbi:MAG TPA: dienelactone hydrolase family protein [Nocardioides sp.]|nr:dienelactone hydrolase family protein [Nocardioides sp.]
MTDDLPPHLRPFVLPHEPVEPVRSDPLDLYLPETTPAPAVLLVHGGPVPADRPVRPPQWPAFRAYAALLARAGLVGAMFEHGYVDDDALPQARENVRSAIDALRHDPRVDPSRVGLWFFSAGGFLMGSFLDPAPEGVVAVAGTYAAVGHPDLAGLGLTDALDSAPRSTAPLLLVRPEHDFDWIAPFTDELLSRCREADRGVDVIDVPDAHHGFETVDDTDAARDAIRASVAWWADALG